MSCSLRFLGQELAVIYFLTDESLIKVAFMMIRLVILRSNSLGWLIVFLPPFLPYRNRGNSLWLGWFNQTEVGHY